MTVDTFDCFDCANASAARELMAAERRGVRVVRDEASSGHAYKEELVEVFGSGYTIADACAMLPRSSSARVSTLFLANEVYAFCTSIARPIILNYWPWERVQDYYASPDGYDRPYGYEPDTLTLLIEMLREHPTTKRAVITFQHPAFLYHRSRDTPCPVSTQYRIVEGRLCTATTYRSHDYFGGYRTDPLRVSFVQQFIAAALCTVDCHVDVGSLTQFDGSLHYYPRKPHGSLSAIALSDHQSSPPQRNWELFTADYVSFDDVMRDLRLYLTSVRYADYEEAALIACPNLRKNAEAVLQSIAAARIKYGNPPHIPSTGKDGEGNPCCPVHAQPPA